MKEDYKVSPAKQRSYSFLPFTPPGKLHCLEQADSIDLLKRE
jgi:hypothetical protein